MTWAHSYYTVAHNGGKAQHRRHVSSTRRAVALDDGGSEGTVIRRTRYRKTQPRMLDATIRPLVDARILQSSRGASRARSIGASIETKESPPQAGSIAPNNPPSTAADACSRPAQNDNLLSTTQDHTKMVIGEKESHWKKLYPFILFG